ncbi:MAG: hypothetical protein ACFFC3_06855 [Candidatus Odinarchaeota archaeon]
MIDFKIYLKFIKDGLAGNVVMLYSKEKVNQKLKPQEDLLENARKRN